jgi:hypothetical protein
MEKVGDTSPYVVPEVFGNKATECRAALAALKEFVAKSRWQGETPLRREMRE